MKNFEIGDKIVWCPKHNYASLRRRGAEGEVLRIDNNGLYVEWQGEIYAWQMGMRTVNKAPIKPIKDCEECKHRLERLLGRCPDKIRRQRIKKKK